MMVSLPAGCVRRHPGLVGAGAMLVVLVLVWFIRRARVYYLLCERTNLISLAAVCVMCHSSTTTSGQQMTVCTEAGANQRLEHTHTKLRGAHKHTFHTRHTDGHLQALHTSLFCNIKHRLNVEDLRRTTGLCAHLGRPTRVFASPSDRSQQ